MEISKKLKSKNYVRQIFGSDIFKHKYKSYKMIYVNNNELFENNEKFDVIFNTVFNALVEAALKM